MKKLRYTFSLLILGLFLVFQGMSVFAQIASLTTNPLSQTISPAPVSLPVLGQVPVALPGTAEGASTTAKLDALGKIEEKKARSWFEGLLIIIYSDAVMSVENVLVIAVLVSEIPARIRMVAVFLGLLAAGVFRVIFASMATLLMKYPVVALLGSITLIFLAISLFTDTIKQLRKKSGVSHSEEKIDWSVVKEELHRMFYEKGFWTSQEGEALKTVMVTVILQDILLSLDNVLVVAGNSQGDLTLTLVGVLISIIMMGTIANSMVSLVKKYPVIGFIGGLALAKAAYNLFLDSYSPEVAVIAFGSIVVFIMFSRVYHKLTSEDEEVKPLVVAIEGETAEPTPVAAAVAVDGTLVGIEETKLPQSSAVFAGAPIPHELVQELLDYLRKNHGALERIEEILGKRNE